MPRIALFVPEPDAGRPANDNHERLPRAFEKQGWAVTCVSHDSVVVQARCVVAQTTSGEVVPLAGFDLYFVLGFGAQATFLDRMQILRSLDQGRFVNTTDALVYQHGKVSLLLSSPDVPQPDTHLANDPEMLGAIVEKGGDWIAKPPASSFGRDVFRLRAGDTNVRAILEHLTREGRYALLQAYVESGDDGERRVLVAAGEIIGTYGKRSVDHRGNIDAGAIAFAAELSDAQGATVGQLLDRLGDMGVRFATVDLAGHYVLEINVANPGWLATYERVTGVDLAPNVARALSRRYIPTASRK